MLCTSALLVGCTRALCTQGIVLLGRTLFSTQRCTPLTAIVQGTPVLQVPSWVILLICWSMLGE